MEQPPGMADPHLPQHVCKLQRTLYRLKQAPHAWFDHFSVFLLKYSFHCSIANPSLFIFHSDYGSLILLLYVDDILVTRTIDTLVAYFITHHIPTTKQIAELFTNPMSKAVLFHFQRKICLQPHQHLREGISNYTTATSHLSHPRAAPQH